jgi:hypothetical protein
MDPETKRSLTLIVAGAVVVGLAVVVLVRNRSVDTELLGTIALVGGVAIILNSLPFGNRRNGNGN